MISTGVWRENPWSALEKVHSAGDREQEEGCQNVQRNERVLTAHPSHLLTITEALEQLFTIVAESSMFKDTQAHHQKGNTVYAEKGEEGKTHVRMGSKSHTTVGGATT